MQNQPGKKNILIKSIFGFHLVLVLLFCLSSSFLLAQSNNNTLKAEIRTPKKSTLRINGPSIYGVRPNSPFQYFIPVAGTRPIELSVVNLPSGLGLNSKTGMITGVIKKKGEYNITLRAKNSSETCEKKLRIVVGKEIALTPTLGWNSWNCWGNKVTGENILRSARAMVSSGLINHGWTYINIDDAWQGKRGGKFNGIQANEKFPDMKGLCDSVHQMGLKIGIYSTPWVTSYASYIGGSSENKDGQWSFPTIPSKGNTSKKILPWDLGKYSFANNDAKQWAEWGIDYLKYDWNPIEVPETAEMAKALLTSGRDIVYSLSNDVPFENIPEISKLANSWRTTGDIRDTWQSMSKIGFSQDKWAAYQRPGHWNDPDMLVVGNVGWGNPQPTHLTANEQYAHITLWSLLSVPMLIGCDMDKLDEFTLNLLTNDEVLDINQDILGKQAVSMSSEGSIRIYVKKLSEGSKAIGLFNLGEKDSLVTLRIPDWKFIKKQLIRDIWRQKDLGEYENEFKINVASHGAELLKISIPKVAYQAPSKKKM